MPAPLQYLWGALLSFVSLAIVNVWVDFDVAISARFYHANGTTPWRLGDVAPWIWLYHYGEYPALVAACGGVLTWLGSLRWSRWRRYRRASAFLALAVVLGPGLVVNGVLKPTWGRPRPRHITAFGGMAAHSPWWQPHGPSQHQGFPSGHAAMGYILVAVACLVPARRSPWPCLLVFSAALTYGTLLGYARILQGGHFASDVICSGGLMCGTVILLYTLLPPVLPGPPQAASP